MFEITIHNSVTTNTVKQLYSYKQGIPPDYSFIILLFESRCVDIC